MNARITVLLLTGFTLSATPSLRAGTSDADMIRTEDLYIRDPFVLPVEESQTYYLYATYQDPETKRRGVQAYKGKDLKRWSPGQVVFEIPDGSWADPTSSLWAPEVFKYQGKYYLFATLSNPKVPLTTDLKSRPDLFLRATEIFVSDSPDGPFEPISDEPQTPMDWMSLDGTLWVEDGQVWMVFCHEWWQVKDGSFELMPLSPDLSKPLAPPLTLFTANKGAWTVDMKKLAARKDKDSPSGKVSDGAFVYKTTGGNLIMLWSSFSESGYTLSYAASRSGKITGPWIPANDILYNQNGGHGMIFKTFSGQLMLTLHSPNDHTEARALFFEVEDTGDSIRIKPAPTEPASLPKTPATPAAD